MIKIEMGNVLSKFIGLDLDIAHEIEANLSYTIGGFGSGQTVNYTFTSNNGMTYTGLVPKIINILKNYNLSYEINDKRMKPERNANFKIVKNYSMRDYQEEIVQRVSSREILQCATGGGKTFIMANLIAKFNVKPVLVIAPKLSLAYQIKEEFEKFLGIEIGILSGKDKEIRDITVGTPQSIPDDYIKKVAMILFEECHNTPANTIFELSNKSINAYYRFGVSATPWRDGEEDILIEAALNIRKPHLSINSSKLIAKRQLTPCTINFIKMDDNIPWQGNYNDTYTKVIANNEKRNNKIIKLAQDSFKEGNSTLLLISKIHHGNYLLNKIRDIIPLEYKKYKIEDKEVDVCNVEFLSGQDDNNVRRAVLQAAKEGFVKILIGSTIADEGLDIPLLSVLILAGSGRSSTRAFQRVGRVLRLHPNKTTATVYDFIDTNTTFYNQAMIRQELYNTEPLWQLNYL